MALAASLAELRAEACCPVCHDFLQEPVTLECGHNCCGSCLQQRWEHLHDVLPCPVCLHPCTDGHPQKNTQLGDMIDLVQQILCMRENSEKKQEENEEEEEEEGRGRCERHQQALSLFCEDDLELLCGQCAASPDHQAHFLTSIAEAAAHHRANLKSCLWQLGEQLEEAVRALERNDAEFTELKGQLKLQKQNVTQEGSHLMQFLKKQETSMGRKLVNLRASIYRHVLKTKQQLSRESCTRKELLMALQKACLQADDTHLLQDVGSLRLAWSQCQSLGFPEAPSWEHKEESPSLPPSYIGLNNMRAKFQVHLRLDPESAHPDLCIASQTTASYCQVGAQPSSVLGPRAFTSHVAVLGAPGFGGGRHFWQVEIRGLGVWCLGVCTEAFSRDTGAAQTPRNGCWQVPVTVSLSLPRLSRGKAAVACFGVFLDYELGEISFYNMSKKTHLHTLTGTFTERLVPYFSVRDFSFSSSLSVLWE
ncbi:tripartite motif-containing protein 75-like [Suncus etruscus]|uniref:tripartite motif-containing protein 75-like n=1 Tax=Suncus etruscus TaxID=109475 RepID=UPI0021105373|nr:tripartite motif-containing protein 75-like [Suncus etruscus]